MATREEPRSSTTRSGGGRPEAELLEANQRLVVAAIREQEAAERSARHAAEMASLMEQLQAGVVVLDDRLAIRLINQAARKILGVAPQKGASLESLAVRFQTLRGEPLAPADSPFGRMMVAGPHEPREVIVLRPDGVERTVVIGGSAIVDASSRVVSGIAVIHDVTEVRELERMREEYVSLISHDLRSPLSAISMAAELLEHMLSAKGLTVEAGNVARIRQSTARIKAMIEDLAESTNLESGHFSLRRKPLDLGALVAELCARTCLPPEAGRVSVEVVGDPPPRVEADPDRIERALANVLTNALKYSPPDAPIQVRCWAAGGEAFVSIQDHGPGIDGQDRQRIFEKYYRSSAQHGADGVGLGLYITHLIVEAHGGRLWVDSQPGNGSTFYLGLPIS